MKDILTAPWMVEMIRTVTNRYDHGWDERNGGNVSLLLEEGEADDSVDGKVLREIPTGFSCTALEGKFFLVTGTGKYFKNVQVAPEVNLGLVRLTNGAASLGLRGRRQIHLRVSRSHDEPRRKAENRPPKPCGHARPPGKPAGHDLCPQPG